MLFFKYLKNNLLFNKMFKSFTCYIRRHLFSRSLSVKKYTNSHEWIKSVDNKNAKIGISVYAAESLGEIVYVEIEKKDDELLQGTSFAALESVKAISDINMPVDGTVNVINDYIVDNPDIINEDPEGKGWIAEITLNKNSLKQLNELNDHDHVDQ
jgi:glycine cleavage system H protein